MDNTTPEFFQLAPRIELHDPLAELLGAAVEGRLVYGYGDAVKLAGHSCPTVAGAWLMLSRGLATLYPDRPAERGGVQVALRGGLEDGTTGVTGAVAGLITGAAGPGGFKGLGGRFVRRGLRRYGVPMTGDLRLTRIDNGQSVELAFHAEVVPMSDALRATMARAVQPDADAPTRAAFAQAWQARVRQIVVDHADDPRVVEIVG
jgi:hypothetical protein